MSEEEDNIVPATWIVKAPRPPNARSCRAIWNAKFAHASANRDVTDAISCHFNLHSVMDAASEYPNVEALLASLIWS